MTPREAFQFAFLYRCAEEGLGPEAAEKRAEEILAKRAGWLGDVANAAGSTLGLSYVAAPVIGAGIGGVAGWSLGKARNSSSDLEAEAAAARRQELISAYRMYAQRAMERKQLNAYVANQRPSRSYGM